MNKYRLGLAAVTILGLGVFSSQQANGWQSALATLGINQQLLENTIPAFDVGIPSTTVAAAKLMTPDQRTAAVREICAALRAIAGTDAFQKSYAAKIKKEYNAVDHGLNLDPAAAYGGDLEKLMANAQYQAAVQVAMMFRSFPNEAIKQAFNDNLEKWTEDAKDRDLEPEERARAQKALTQAKAIAPLMQSNPEAFKKAYSLLKSEEMGGPTTEAALTGAANTSEADLKKQSEQSQWNQHNFKVVLKKQLTGLVATAATVDFNAQTKKEAGRDVFVNPAYEGKSGEWKLMYRVGRGPVTAAADFANAWIPQL
jgi:hypothetical protein